MLAVRLFSFAGLNDHLSHDAWQAAFRLLKLIKVAVGVGAMR